VAGAPGFAGGGAESCATKTGAIWQHNVMIAKAVTGLQEIRFFIRSSISPFVCPVNCLHAAWREACRWRYAGAGVAAINVNEIFEPVSA
jgi:hypothetical protein